MENCSDSYQNGGGRHDTDFQKLAQIIGTNVHKVLQNFDIEQIWTEIMEVTEVKIK